MSAKTAVIIQHVLFEDIGHFAQPLQNCDYRLQVLEAHLIDWALFDPLYADLLIVLGGPIGVNDQAEYPFLRQELAALQQRLRAKQPTLGICLGAQLIASALGAAVYPAQEKEIGWHPVRLTQAGHASPLATLGDAPVLHWHGDTFDLPPEAVLLAATEICPHQAFALETYCLALQFHPEVTTSGLERWFIGHTHEIHHSPGLSVARLREDTLRYAPGLKVRGEELLSTWLAQLKNLTA